MTQVRKTARLATAILLGFIAGVASGLALTWLVLLPSAADLEQTALSLVPSGFVSVSVHQQERDLILGGARTAMVRARRPGPLQASVVDLAAVARQAGLDVEDEESAPNGQMVIAVSTGTVAYMLVRGDLVDGLPATAFAADVRRRYGPDVLWPIPVAAIVGTLLSAVLVSPRLGRQAGRSTRQEDADGPRSARQ